MNVYLATPHTYRFENMNIYLATPNSSYFLNAYKEMEIYLAGAYSRPNVIKDKDKIFVLESFFYIQEWMYPYIKNHWDFMLDSGAFSTFADPQKAKEVDWTTYVKNYIKLINKLDIDLFFELDIDAIVGIKKVEYYRKLIEDGTGKQPIPVWHSNRKWDYFEQMCEDYNYVALGTTTANEEGKRMRNKPKVLANFINYAHKNNTKIHGLGFTSIPKLTYLKWDSVDSTAWIYGNRGGFIYKFTGRDLIKIQAPKGKKLKAKKVAEHNFKEWVKFQKYAKHNL